MDYPIYKDRGDGEFPRNRSRGQGARRKKGKKEKNRVCAYLSLRKRRMLKLIKDMAELILLWGAVYLCMVIGTDQLLWERLPQIRTGTIWIGIGVLVWIAADLTERYLRTLTKK